MNFILEPWQFFFAILKEHGIEPAPERKRQTTWTTFIKAHWDVLASIDFTTIEVWTKGAG